MSQNALSQILPDRKSWLRAVVSAIPTVAGALDHLLFDKADAIRLGNIESTLKALSARLEQVTEASIDKEWFRSEEALATLRLITEKVAFEPNKQKVEDLGRVAGACGLYPQSKDPKKLSVVEHLSRLSPVQTRLLKVLAGMPFRSKTLSGGRIQQTITALWAEDIKSALECGQKFWDGDLDLRLELEILESLNTVRRAPVLVSADLGYDLTALGRHAASYVEQARLAEHS